MGRRKSQPTADAGADTPVTADESTQESKAAAQVDAAASEEAAVAAPPKRRRGRPRKTEPALSTMGLSLAAMSAKTEDEKAPPAEPSGPPLPPPASREKAPAQIIAAPVEEQTDSGIKRKAPTRIAPPPAELKAHALDQAPPEALEQDVSIAGASIETSMDSMVKQWGMVKDISTTVCSNLEKVTKLLTEQTADLEAIKAPTPKPSPITRWAIGASVFATVLSVVSLSLSQTARQEVLTKESRKETQSTAPARPSFAFDALGGHQSAHREKPVDSSLSLSKDRSARAPIGPQSEDSRIASRSVPEPRIAEHHSKLPAGPESSVPIATPRSASHGSSRGATISSHNPSHSSAPSSRLARNTRHHDRVGSRNGSADAIELAFANRIRANRRHAQKTARSSRLEVDKN